MSSVAVIGCNGQLGADCMRVLAGAKGVDLPEIDIAHRDSCVRKLNELKPVVLINCAGYTNVEACESDPACWEANADGPMHLANWARNNDTFLVHISTDYVFSGDKPLFEGYVETDETSPLSRYGKSKVAGEQAVLESGARAAVLRTAWMYGVIGKNFPKSILRLALQDPEREIRVVCDQFGSPTWSYTLARQIAAVIDMRATGLFHVTSEGFCSWYDLAMSFLSRMNVPHRLVPCTTAEYPTTARRPKNSILENARAKSMGLPVFRDWEMDVEAFVQTFRNQLISEAEGALRESGL